jgi:hypothetical protein
MQQSPTMYIVHNAYIVLNINYILCRCALDLLFNTHIVYYNTQQRITATRVMYRINVKSSCI